MLALKRIAPIIIIALLSACASSGTTPSTGSSDVIVTSTPPASPWGVKTREHIDLWLHGYGMIQEDTTLIPFFRRGYKDQMIVRKNQVSAMTQLDANTENLKARLSANRNLVNGQFIPLYFNTIEDMQRAMNMFFASDGDPRQAGNAEDAQAIAMLAGNFQTRPDRDWARLLWQSLEDERNKFYSTYWKNTQRDRFNVVTVVDSLWQKMYRPRLQRFLNNTQQSNGTIMLSLPLDGEGRTLNAGKNGSVITVTFPESEANAVEAIYVIIHEIVGSTAASAVNDNTTPNDRRTGVADRLQSAAAVRGGAMLLQRTIPELADGYARHYLRAANKPVGANPIASLQTHFPLPKEIPEGMSSQLDIILGGV